VRREPRLLGVKQTRWTLGALLGVVREQLGWKGVGTVGGLARLLGRVRIRRKRGRGHIHSPDACYPEKRAEAQARVELARAPGPSRIVTCYLDEVTYERQPSLASAYEAVGRDPHTGHTHQPLARLSPRGQTLTRAVGALDVSSGQVVWRQGWKVGIKELVAFYEQLRAAYPDAERLYVIQDNWPVHFHPDVLVALEPQTTPWPPKRPPSWSDDPSPAAVRRWGRLHLPIQLVFLPTYASWLNPIEKLWRWLRQDVLHLHRLADDLVTLREAVATFLDRFAQPGDLTAALLRYVGLHPPD
jgi:hypothetical protein